MIDALRIGRGGNFGLNLAIISLYLELILKDLSNWDLLISDLLLLIIYQFISLIASFSLS